VHRLQRRPRLDADLIGQPRPGAAIGVQGVGLPTAPVKGE
jgi:hypothetical protein